MTKARSSESAEREHILINDIQRVGAVSARHLNGIRMQAHIIINKKELNLNAAWMFRVIGTKHGK